MAFNIISNSTSNRATVCGVGAICVYKTRFAAKFRVPCEVTKILGWTPETRVAVMWGSGADKGKVLLAETPGGYATTWPGRAKAIYIQTTKVPDWIPLTKKCDITNVDHEITDDGLLLTLPSFLAPPPN